MASRNDLDITYNDDPRVAEVQAPSAEIIMQDLVDTLRDAEYSWQGNTFKKLVNASGKEDLGGGVKVGITVAMQNLLLAFAGRTTPAETGTVTSNPGSSIAGRDQFVDTSADFVTANVQRGSLVINFTDFSIADVISVDDLNTLTTKTLVNGTGNTYDVADVYHVFNIVQVSATGGNLTAVDALQATIAAILPTAFTQVVLTSSASATIQEQIDVQFSSFGGGVHVDQGNTNGFATSGTDFPTGTPRQPCDNFTDALTIATERGFERIFVHGDAVFPVGLDMNSIEFVGQSLRKTLITIPNGAIVDDCEYIDATITGTMDGISACSRCTLVDVTDLDGEMVDCGLTGFIRLKAGGEGEFINCHSEVAGGAGTPQIFIGTAALLGRNYSGGIHFKGKMSSMPMSWDMSSGQVVVDNDNVGGTLVLRGVGKWQGGESYLGNTLVQNEMLTGTDLQNLRKLMTNKMVTDPITGIMTIYDDDSVTVLLRGNIFEDVLAAQIYRGRGMERRDRLVLVTDTFAAEFGPEFD